MTTLTVDGRGVEVTNATKALFPADGITKQDLAEYYRAVAPAMLPHLAGRPLTLERYPDGIDDDGFFQKEAPDYFPEWIPRADVEKEGGRITHAMCEDAPTLVYLANQGTLTLHTWLSRADMPHQPDRIIFDLDPPDDDKAGLRLAVRAVRNLGREIGLTPFLMTTGSKGFHVVFPITRGPTFDDTKAFARDFAEWLAHQHPEQLTTEQRKANRGARVFIDYLRNAYAQTAVAPYSVRAREGAPVATPVDWVEYGRGTIGPRTYTMRTIPRRLAQKDDPWRDMAWRAAPLEEAAGRLRSRALSRPARR